MDISSALACALVYWVMRYLDNTTGWDALARPIVVAPVIGLALGDPKTGIIMGASLEAIFMGISAIGGSIRHGYLRCLCNRSRRCGSNGNWSGIGNVNWNTDVIYQQYVHTAMGRTCALLGTSCG